MAFKRKVFRNTGGKNWKSGKLPSFSNKIVNTFFYLENRGDWLFGVALFYSKFGSSCSPNTFQGSNPQKAIIKPSLVSTVTNCFIEQNRNLANSLNFLNVKQRSYCSTEVHRASLLGREMGQELCLSKSIRKKICLFFEHPES